MKTITIVLLVLIIGCGVAYAGTRIILELFLVGPESSGVVHYDRRTVRLSSETGDPDTVARGQLRGACSPAILHSTSWRWEKDGTLVLTYVAYTEDEHCRALEHSQIELKNLFPPQNTDPLKPRPVEIREHDVLAHGLRHITFLVRYSQDDRIRQALSPRSLRFFEGLCGQLAGRYDTAKEFADCKTSK
jgi:hypothetical protein